MLKSIGILILFGGLTYLHIPQLKKDKLKRELVILVALMLLVTTIEIAKINGVALPNPLELISITIEPFNRMLTTYNK